MVSELASATTPSAPAARTDGRISGASDGYPEPPGRHGASTLHKGLLLVALPLIVQLVTLGVFFQLDRQLDMALQSSLRTKDVIAATESAARSLTAAHNELARAVLVGGGGLQEMREPEAATLRASVGELESLALVPELAQRSDDVLRFAATADRVIVGLAQVRDQLAAESSAAVPGLISLWDDVGELERIAGSLRFAANEQDRERVRRLAELSSAQGVALAVAAILTVVVTTLLGWFFLKSFVRRLDVMRRNTQRMAAGQELLPAVGGGDEIGRLDQAFHDLAAALAAQQRDNQMFVYSVSHDLRSPLVNLQGFSEELRLASRRLAELVASSGVPAAVRSSAERVLHEDVAEAVDFIQASVERQAATIDSLLRLSRIGSVQYDWEIVDLRAAVQRVVTELTPRVSEVAVDITIGELPQVQGDVNAIERIFANVIGNAQNYRDPSREPIISIDSVDGDGETIVVVRDNGPGIPASQIDRVLLPFARLRPGVPGEGIGLALVRRAMERHHGRMWLESEVGTGTSVHLAFPTVAGATGRSAYTAVEKGSWSNATYREAQ